MLLPEVIYLRPTTLDDALNMLRDTVGARPLAGGQTLINAMKLRLVAPPAVVDISHLDELRHVRVTHGGGLDIGAGTTYADLERSPDVRARYSIVADVAAGTVDRQVRNRGTIGGNACLADPTSNFPPLLVMLDATMRVAGGGCERTVPAAEFFTGPLRVALEPGELLTGIELPPPLPDSGVGHHTLQKTPASSALARAAAWVRATPDQVVDARLVLGCVSPTPLRATAAERALIGSTPSADAVASAAALIGPGLVPPSDVHASGEYRAAMARVAAERALLAALRSRDDRNGSHLREASSDHS